MKFHGTFAIDDGRIRNVVTICLSQAQLEKELMRILAPTSDGIIPEMKTDFRKLVVTYACSANGDSRLCTRFKPGPCGECTYRVDETICISYKES